MQTTSFDGKILKHWASSPQRGCCAWTTDYQRPCWWIDSLSFLFFVTFFGARSIPPKVTWWDQQDPSRQNPTSHSKHFIVVFFSTRLTLLHQIHLTCFLFFKNRCVCAYIIGPLVTEDKLSVELFIATCGNVVDCLPIAVSIISLHKTLAKPVIVSNSLFFVLKHFHASVANSYSYQCSI